VSAATLPSRPSLERLRNEARELQRAIRSGDLAAIDELADQLPHRVARAAELRLADAQLLVARRYGFATWAALRQHVHLVAGLSRLPHEVPVDDGDAAHRFLTLACLTYGTGDSADRWQAAARLLESDPDVATTDIWTMAAAGEDEAVGRLLAADPQRADEPGGPHRWEPLLYATYARIPGRSTLAVAEVLLGHGADPNAGFLWDGVNVFTALTGALGGGEDAVNQPPHPEAMRLARALLEAGADPNDSQALYNRMFTAEDAHLELLFEYGLGRGDGGPWRARLGSVVESIEDGLAMQLQWAAEHGLVGRVRLLLDHGVDPEAACSHPTFGGRTAYELAVLRGHGPVADLLVARGAIARDLDPADALVAACTRLDRAAAEQIIATVPGVVALAEERTPVADAAAAGQIEAIRLMVELGFDVNARQRTAPLHQAAASGRVEGVAVLLDLGADPNLRDEAFGATALGWARHHDREEVAAILRPLTEEEVEEEVEEQEEE
jgi:hypothetical protein